MGERERRATIGKWRGVEGKLCVCLGGWGGEERRIGRWRLVEEKKGRKGVMSPHSQSG